MTTIIVINLIALWLLLALNASLSFAVIGRLKSIAGQKPQMQDFLKPGVAAPLFKAMNLNNVPVTLENFIGKATAFIFVNPQCEPCKEKIPSLQRLHQSIEGKPVNIVLVSDSDIDSAKDIFGSQLSMPIICASRENNSFYTDYKITSTPSYVFINPNGTIESSDIYFDDFEETYHTWLSRTQFDRTSVY